MGETPPLAETLPPVQAALADVESPEWQSSFPEPLGVSERNPFIKHDSKPLGGTMEPVDWDFSALKPEPAFLSAASAETVPGHLIEKPSVPEPLSAEPAPEPTVHPPIEWNDSAMSPEPEFLSTAASPPAEAAAQPNEQITVLDSSGQEWLDLGINSSGMHKISSLDHNQIKIISEETFQQFTPTEAQPQVDSEKQAMRETIESLTAKVGQLEARLAKLESNTDLRGTDPELIVGGDSRKVYGPEEQIDAFIRKTREENLAQLEKLNSSPSARFHSAWEKTRKSLIENAKRTPGAITDKSKDIVKGAVQVASPYIKKAVEPIGVGMMYGQVLAENGPRLAGEASRKVLETVSEATHQAIEASKEPIGVGIAMVQVAGEKTAQAAGDTLSQGTTAARMTAESINSKAESIRSYRRRRICAVVGAGVMMWSVIFGPARVEAPTNDYVKSDSDGAKIDATHASAEL